MKMYFTGDRGSYTSEIWKMMRKPRFTRSTSVLACTHRAGYGFRCRTQHPFKDSVFTKMKDTRRDSHVMRLGLVDTLSFVRGSIDPVVLGSTANAAFKLVLICGIVRWLSESGRIPENTSVVLAQVSFQLLIPCMLFSKVVSILALQPDLRLLLGMVVAAVSQIIIGGLWGALLSPLIDGKYPKMLQILARIDGSSKDSAIQVAKATSQAMGVPHAAEALLPKPTVSSKGYKSLIAAACAFQNSFTLPAVFLLSLLPGVLADRAVAYLGLFLLAWSPILWSFGLYSIQKGYEDDLKESSPSMGEDGQYIEPSASTTNATLPWKKMVQGAMNPPVIAVLVAATLGLSPLGGMLFSPGSISSIASRLPFELSLVFHGLGSAYEVIEMLGKGTLAIQTLVLAASLLQPSNETRNQERKGLFSDFIAYISPNDDLEMLQAVMPSAQNLIIALQISPKTQSASPAFAKLLLKLYFAAIIPVTLWVTGFASRLAIPLI
eukprot:jgi/Picsp_1/1248/NSC_04729-R1_auxin efflux carrier family